MNQDSKNIEKAKTQEPVLSIIKIRRKTFEIKKNDYILYNGACHQLCAGDGRTLIWEGYFQYSNVVIPKSTVKSIPLHKLEKHYHHAGGQSLVLWFF